MTDGSPSFKKMSHGLEVVLPGKGKGFVMLILEWTPLKEKVANIKPPRDFYWGIGTALWGISGSGAIGGLVLDTQGLTKIFYWVICGLVFICGVLCAYIHSEQKEKMVISTKDVLKEMDRIEKIYYTHQG